MLNKEGFFRSQTRSLGSFLGQSMNGYKFNYYSIKINLAEARSNDIKSLK
ncbi:hypothetical protein HMPREF9176_0219 [Streptococcus downei F0415]|nr:hypothetical protein HMPREF9176_0219 [Streptococcus downei F0415]